MLISLSKLVWRGNFRWSCQFQLLTLLWGAIIRRRAADQNENVGRVCSFRFLPVRLTGAKQTGAINFSTHPFSMRVVFKTILSLHRLRDLFLSCLVSSVLHGSFLPLSSFTWWPAPCQVGCPRGQLGRFPFLLSFFFLLTRPAWLVG